MQGELKERDRQSKVDHEEVARGAVRRAAEALAPAPTLTQAGG